VLRTAYRQILGENYFRLAPVFPPDMVIPLDGVKRISELVEFAAGQWTYRMRSSGTKLFGSDSPLRCCASPDV
jgi:hypothetical protein